MVLNAKVILKTLVISESVAAVPCHLWAIPFSTVIPHDSPRRIPSCARVFLKDTITRRYALRATGARM